MTVVARSSRLRQWEWLSPTSIDATGVRPVSRAITDWLTYAGQPGDLFRLRQGFYWVPQGIRVPKAMTLDLNGSWLFTGTVLGPEDPDLAGSVATYGPIWGDVGDALTWPRHRTAIRVVASDVNILSSVASARVIGAARKVVYRSGNTLVPEGCEFNSTFEGQHAVRFGYDDPQTGDPVARSGFDLDLTNISLEFCSGDGVYLMDLTSDVRIHGVNAPRSTIDANIEFISGPKMGATGGLPDGIDVDAGGGGTYDLWMPGLTGYPGIHHTARQGIAFTQDHDGITIEDISLWRIGRSAIDMEIGTGWRAHNVTVRRVEFGHWYLGMISSGSIGSIENLLIEDCYSYKEMAVNCHNDSPTVDRGTNWTIRRNRARFRYAAVGSHTLVVDRIDGLTITDNYAFVQTTDQGIDPGDSTSVTVSPAEDTQFVPTTVLVCASPRAGVAAASGRALRVSS